MTHTLARTKISERAELVGRAENIMQVAADQDGRDLSEQEQAALAQYRGRIGELDGQLALMTADFALDAETAANIARWSGTPVPTNEPCQWRSAGEALWDYLHKETDREARQRIGDFERNAGRLTSGAGKPSESYVQFRAAQHQGTLAANTTPVAGGFGGLIVSPIAGPVIDLGWSGTPLLNALGAQDAPNAYSFSRPRIIDPHLNDGAQEQALEKAELVSYKFDIEGEPVRMRTVGGYLNVSQQLLSVVPGSMDIVVTQLRRRAQRAAEKSAATGLSGTTATVPLATNDAQAVIDAFGEAALKVFNATGELPSWVAMGPLGWQILFGVTDADGRQLFPSIGPVNASGSTGGVTSFSINVFGLAGVVTPGITDDGIYLGSGESVELYRTNLPLLEAVEPSVLGRQVAVAIGLGSYLPITTESPDGGTTPAKREAVVKIDPA